MTKSAREIMEILESFDLTRCYWSAGHLAGCDAKTIARYVERRDAGAHPYLRSRRPRILDVHYPHHPGGNGPGRPR